MRKREHQDISSSWRIIAEQVFSKRFSKHGSNRFCCTINIVRS